MKSEKDNAATLVATENFSEVDEQENPWTTISTREIYENPWISVREDAVIRPDGKDGIYGVVHFRNVAVGVIAVDKDDCIYLVGQYRYPLNQYSWEIPEGGCPEGEDPLEAAQRELAEETGLCAKNWIRLCEAHLSNSVSDELAVVYVATDLKEGKSQPEGTEKLNVRRVRFDGALEMALTGKITDALSLLGIMRYQLERLKSRA